MGTIVEREGETAAERLAAVADKTGAKAQVTNAKVVPATKKTKRDWSALSKERALTTGVD